MPFPNALTTARQKLQLTDVPFPLRVSYYLRISCLALNSSRVRYSRLMAALYTQNPAWLETCTVTSTGRLQSSDRTINTLLRPITALHQTQQLTKFARIKAA